MSLRALKHITRDPFISREHRAASVADNEGYNMTFSHQPQDGLMSGETTLLSNKLVANCLTTYLPRLSKRLFICMEAGWC